MLTSITEEEKKILTSMAGKINVTAASDPEKLQTLLDLTAEAIDLKIATDAPSRNALTKLHATLVKITGEVESRNAKSQREDKDAVLDDEGEATVVGARDDVQEPAVAGSEEEDEDEEEATKMEIVQEGGEGEGEDEVRGVAPGVGVKDSILDDLLDEEDEEL